MPVITLPFTSVRRKNETFLTGKPKKDYVLKEHNNTLKQHNTSNIIKQLLNN